MILVRKELRGVEIVVADRERNSLEFLRTKHPNLIRLHFAYRHGGNSNLIFSYFPHDLRHILREGRDPEQLGRAPTPRKYKGSILNHWLWENLADVFEALPSIHEPGEDILGAHFDLKPANILVDSHGRLVITDFGLARFKKKSQNGHSSLTNPGGDFNYRQPPTESRLSRAYDVWSLACIMVEIIVYIMHGRSAVQSFANDLEIEDSTQTRAQTFWKQDGGRYVLKTRVTRLLQELQESRKDLYLKKVGIQLQAMFEISPKLRPTTADVFKALFARNSNAMLTLQQDGFNAVCGADTKYSLRQMYVFFFVKNI